MSCRRRLTGIGILSLLAIGFSSDRPSPPRRSACNASCPAVQLFSQSGACHNSNGLPFISLPASQPNHRETRSTACRTACRKAVSGYRRCPSCADPPSEKSREVKSLAWGGRKLAAVLFEQLLNSSTSMQVGTRPASRRRHSANVAGADSRLLDKNSSCY